MSCYPDPAQLCFVEGEDFRIQVQFVAEGDETPYTTSEDYTVTLDWRIGGDISYSSVSTPAVSVSALTGDDNGVEVSLTIPGETTELWPSKNDEATGRIQRDGLTVAWFELVPSPMNENIGTPS